MTTGDSTLDFLIFVALQLALAGIVICQNRDIRSRDYEITILKTMIPRFSPARSHRDSIIGIAADGHRKSMRVHRLILEAFAGRRDDMEGCHYPDPNKRNCRTDNLRWGTRSENQDDIRKLGRNASILDKHKVAAIKAELSNGVSAASIARREGVHRDTISRIKLGKNWRHVADVADPIP